MNILIFGDIHLKKSELKECELVLEEIGMLCKQYKVDKVIDLADTFDKINPASECLDSFSTFINRLNKPIIILAADSHESTTESESVLNHFEILHPNVSVIKKYMDEVYMFCGHFVLNESKLNYGAKFGKKDFKQYKYVFLGHQHSHQVIKPNICHLGSCRYVDFAEVDDKAKVVCLIENYKANNEKCHFLALKSPYPMKDVSYAQKVAPEGSETKFQAQNEAYMDRLDPKTKVRAVFKDFKSYSQIINNLDKYKEKFILFKIKQDFLVNDNVIATKQKTENLKESLLSYLEENKTDNDIKQILLKEIR